MTASTRTAQPPASTRWRAHDLLRIAHLPIFDDEPDWLRAAFLRAPFAVVRRARAAPGCVAIGLRGATRAQRFGALLDTNGATRARIEAVFSPEDLVGASVPRARADLPAFRAFAQLRAAASPLDAFAWGPTGSAGFELAARAPTLTASSDLDVLIRAPQRCAPDRARALLDAFAQVSACVGARIDAQLETPAGGVALAELAQLSASARSRILARGEDGPALVADPWEDQ